MAGVSKKDMNRERIFQNKLEGVFAANGSLRGLDNTALIAFRAKMINMLGLNPATIPFRFYMDSRGDIFLYATKSCCAQLRDIRKINVVNSSDYVRDDVLKTITMKVTGVNKFGRSAIATGSVCYEMALPEDVHNYIMWAETKALRRLTLDLSGLGVLSDVEVRDMKEVAEYNVIEEEKEPGDVDVPIQTDDTVKADSVKNLINSFTNKKS